MNTGSSISKVPDNIIKMMNAFDPANKQIALLGFPDMLASERIKHIAELFAKFPSYKVCDYGTIFSGPHNDRKPTNNCFIEFSTSDKAKSFLDDTKIST